MIIDIVVNRDKHKTLVMGGGDNKVGQWRYATTEDTLYINTDKDFFSIPLASLVRQITEKLETPQRSS